MIAAYNVPKIFGVKMLGKGGGALEVAKHDRKLTALGIMCGRGRRADFLCGSFGLPWGDCRRRGYRTSGSAFSRGDGKSGV